MKSPSIGFRLAYSQLQSKKYIESINTCKQILQIYPDYPKLKTEVLEQAQEFVR